MESLFVVFVCFIAGSAAQGILYLELNSKCDSLGNVERRCTRLENCPDVLVGIQRRVFPEICSFDGLEPVVCCPMTNPTTSTTAVPTSLLPGVGEVCQDGAERWYCRRHQDCPGARDEIKNGWSPRICSFYNREPVICCPPSAEVTPPRTNRPNQWTSWTRPSENGNNQPTWQTRPGTRPWQRPTTSNSWEMQTTQNSWPSWTRPPHTTPQPDRERPPIWGGNQPSPGSNNGVSTARPSKAEQMCKKYGQYVYKKVRPPILLADVEEKLEPFCGRTITPLIVKGENAGPREFPHMARIGYGNKQRIEWLCGGSLISERFVLSAAHCTKPGQRLASWVSLGDLDTSRTNDDAQEVTIRIIERFDHPKYQTDNSLYHDIALYKLERDAPLGIYIRPICLNTQLELRDTTAVASGWGHTIWRDPGGGSDLLQKVELKLVPPERCNNSYKSHIPKELPKGIYPDYMICAGGHDGKDTCQGDSGGPLQIARREPYCTYSIIGVTSFGKGCGSTTPGVYTNVAHYLPWIESIVWPT